MKYITWLNTLLDEIYYWMKYITGWNTLHVLDEIHYLMKYITGWNTLLDEIHYWMKYITGWNTLLDEIHYLMKYITLWYTLRYESRSIWVVWMLYLIYCVFVIKHESFHKILFWKADHEIWLLLMLIFWYFSWWLCWDVSRSL